MKIEVSLLDYIVSHALYALVSDVDVNDEKLLARAVISWLLFGAVVNETASH